MPFFGSKNIAFNVQDSVAPLQAITPSVHSNETFRKRVWISVSCLLKNRETGSMTIEGALSLTVFLFMAVLLVIPMRIMNTERQMQEALESVGEDIAQYAYLKTLGDDIDKVKGAETDSSIHQAAGIAADAGGKLYGTQKIKEMTDTEQIRNISLFRSSILEDGYTIDLIVDYEICLPFSIFHIDALKRQLRCCRRAWTGMEGGKNKKGDREDEEEIVYIGKGSTRYHKNRFCHYLFNDISQEDLTSLEWIRNSQGKRYRPCSVCGKEITGGTVYIMPSGESYHSRADCRAIVAYVEAVPLKTVEHMGPCSYCSGSSQEGI